MNPTITDGGDAMPSHTTPTNEPQFKPLPQATISKLQRYYNQIVTLYYSMDYNSWLAYAHLHEYLAYKMTSDAAIKRHARLAELFYEAAEESRHDEVDPSHRVMPSKHFTQKYGEGGVS